MQGIKVIVEAVDRVTAPIRRISGSLRAINLAPLREQLGRVVSAAKSAAGEIARTVRNVAIGISGLAVGVGAMMLNVMRRSNEAAVAAERVGVSMQSFQGFGYAAQRTGAETADMADALKDLNLKILEAVNGNDDLASGFRRMGVSLRDAQGNLRPTEEIFVDLADAFARVPDGAKKSAAAIALMGEAGLKMIPMLNQGSDNLREIMEEAERLGIVLDEKTAAAFKSMSLDIVRLQAASTGLQNTIASKLLPVIQPLVAGFTDWIITNRELIATNILAWMEELPGLFESATATALAWKDALEPVTSAISAIVEQLGPMNASLAFLSIIVAGKLIPVFLPLIRLTWLLGRAVAVLGMALGRLAFGPLVAGLGRMFTAIRAGTGVMAAFNAVMLANPIGLVVAAVAALAGSAYLIYRNWEDVGPFFGRLWRSVQRSFNGVVEFVAGVFTLDFQRAFDGLKEIVSGWRDWIVTIWSGVYGAFRAFVDWLDGTFGTRFGNALDAVEAKAAAIVDGLMSIWSPVRAAFARFAQWLSGAFAGRIEIALGGVRRVFAGLVEFVAGVFTLDFERAFDGLKEIVTGWRDWIMTIWSGVYGAFRAFVNWLDRSFGTRFSAALDVIEEKVRNVVDGLMTAWSPVRRAFAGLVEFVAGAFTLDFQRAFDGLKEIVSGWRDWIVTVWSGVRRAFRAFVDWLDGTFGTRFADALAALETKVVEIVGKLGTVWEPVKAAWEGISAWVRDTFAPAMQSAVEYVSSLIMPIIDAIAAAIGAISVGIDSAVAGAQRAGEAVDRAGAAVRSSLPNHSVLPEPLAPVRGIANPRNPSAAVGAAAGAGGSSPDRSLGPRSQAPDVPTVFGPGGSPAPGTAGTQVAQKVDAGGTLRLELADGLKLASARMNDRRMDVSAGQSLAMS